MEVKEDDEEREKAKAVYFYQMLCLVVDVGATVLRKLFLKQKLPGQTDKKFLKIKADELKGKKNLYPNQIKEIKSQDVSRFDITLLCSFIFNVTDIPSRSPTTKALLEKLKDVRDVAIAHAPKCKMEESDFITKWRETTDILIQLADEVGQADKDSVKEEIDMIKKIQLGDMCNKLDTLHGWGRQDQILSCLEEVNKKSDQGIKLLEEIKSIAQANEDQGKTHTDQLKTLTDQMRQSPGTSSGTESSEMINPRAQKELAGNLVAEKTKSEAKQSQEDNGTKLRAEIIEHYKETGSSTTAIPVLMDGEEVDIDKIFVMPSMEIRENTETGRESRNSKPDSKQESKPDSKPDSIKVITTIHELYMKDGKSIRRRVCILGDAGKGKTSLCRKIVSDWCKVHGNSEKSPDTDHEFLKRFDLLFYLPLRNHNTFDVIEMVKREIVREALHNDLNEFLKKESEKCLIILDGLDEWQPSEDYENRVPYINPREKFTVLMTSRPWKLGVLQPKMYEIGQKVELIGIENDKLVEAVVNILNNKPDTDKERNWKHFKYRYSGDTVFSQVTETYKKLKHLAEIPTILTQMVCMWYYHEIVRNTRVEIYSKLLDYLFQVAEKRDPEIFDSEIFDSAQRSTNNQLVTVFKDLVYCKKYREILCKLSELAYNTLFNKRKENRLVFLHSDTEKAKLTEKDMEVCHKVGILSQTNIHRNASKHTQGISFLHKTFQEFLAALYVADEGKDESFKEMCDTLKSLEDVLEMSQVLIFLSGLRPALILAMSHHIAQLSDTDNRVLQYRNTLKIGAIDETVHFLNKLMGDCIVEIVENKMLGYKFELRDVHVLFPMIPYLSLESVKSLTESLSGPKKNWTNLNGHDLVKLGVVIRSQEDINHLTSTVKGCASSLTCLSVDFWGHPVNMNYFLTSLKEIRHITCFELKNVNLTHSDIEYLGTTLSQSTQLNEIIIFRIRCTTCQQGQQCSYRIDLSHHKQLQYLSIMHLNGDIVLSNEVPVEHCIIENVKCAVSILDRLKSSTHLHELKVESSLDYTNSIFSSTSTEWVPTDNREVHLTILYVPKVLIDVIPTLKNLRILELDGLDFKQDILRLSSEMTSLERVIIRRSTMTLQCLQGLIDRLLQTQVYVRLVEVSICPGKDTSTALKYITDKHQITPNWLYRLTTEIPIGMTASGRLELEFTNRPPH